MKELYEMSLNEILDIKDSEIRIKTIYWFYSEVVKLNTGFAKSFGLLDEYLDILNGDLSGYYPESIMSLARMIEEEEYKNTSNYFKEGHVLRIWPSIKVVKARKYHLCTFSGAIISPGSEHLVYKLFIKDYTDKSKYCLAKPLRAEIGYEDKFPTTLMELDDFEYKLSHAYELGLEDFYNISTNLKTDHLPIKKLK